MKTCLVCLQPQPDSAETCPECGEASWGAAVSAPAAAPAASETPGAAGSAEGADVRKSRAPAKPR